MLFRSVATTVVGSFLLCAVDKTAQAWTHSVISSTRSLGSGRTQQKSTTMKSPLTSLSPKRATTTTTTALFTVPPPSTEDREAFKEYASRQPPPASFFELQKDSIRAAKLAIKDGYDLLEVEFPPLPAKVLEMDDVSAYDVAQANLDLAVKFARGFTVDGSTRVTILFPDESEAKIAIETATGKEDVKPTTEIDSGITISSLRRSEEGDDRAFKVRYYRPFFVFFVV